VNNLPIFYTSADVQHMMRCCRSTLNNRIRFASDFPKPSKFGRNLIWDARRFDLWLANRYGVTQ
jgi:predicted DNA-binding transcriptional regulator AlpA